MMADILLSILTPRLAFLNQHHIISNSHTHLGQVAGTICPFVPESLPVQLESGLNSLPGALADVLRDEGFISAV